MAVSQEHATADPFLDRLIGWATADPLVRALVLTGSRARDEPFDRLADYDLVVIANAVRPFLAHDEWMATIGSVTVWIPERYSLAGVDVPTRLVLFEGPERVDFSFITTDDLPAVAMPPSWVDGYRLLLDKDELTRGWPEPAPGSLRRTRPDDIQFTFQVNELWFEAFHVAKYLRRGELWLAQFRLANVRQLLLTMVEWQALAASSWRADTHYLGKGLRQWADPATVEALGRTFSHFDAEDLRKAIGAACDLIDDLGRDAAVRLGLEYPLVMAQQVRRDIEGILDPDRFQME